jgi:hypothetical protein
VGPRLPRGAQAVWGAPRAGTQGRGQAAPVWARALGQGRRRRWGERHSRPGCTALLDTPGWAQPLLTIAAHLRAVAEGMEPALWRWGAGGGAGPLRGARGAGAGEQASAGLRKQRCGRAAQAWRCCALLEAARPRGMQPSGGGPGSSPCVAAPRCFQPAAGRGRAGGGGCPCCGTEGAEAIGIARGIPPRQPPRAVGAAPHRTHYERRGRRRRRRSPACARGSGRGPAGSHGGAGRGAAPAGRAGRGGAGRGRAAAAFQGLGGVGLSRPGVGGRAGAGAQRAERRRRWAAGAPPSSRHTVDGAGRRPAPRQLAPGSAAWQGGWRAPAPHLLIGVCEGARGPVMRRALAAVNDLQQEGGRAPRRLRVG